MKAWFKRLLGRSAAVPTAPAVTARTPIVTPSPKVATTEQIDWLRDQIRSDVASGFYDEDTILKNAAEAFADEFEPVELRARAQNLLRAALAEQAAAEADWPVRTDWNRLEDAFNALAADGIVARHNFTCCGNCGSSEIWDEVDAVRAAGGPARGYAFYHMQDTESAVEGHGLYLNYGACDEGEPAALAVAHAIVAQLEAQGLNTDWTGSWDQRIGVSLEWQRRRQGSVAGGAAAG